MEPRVEHTQMLSGQLWFLVASQCEDKQKHKAAILNTIVSQLPHWLEGSATLKPLRNHFCFLPPWSSEQQENQTERKCYHCTTCQNDCEDTPDKRHPKTLQESVSLVLWIFCPPKSNTWGFPLPSKVKFPGGSQSICQIPNLGNLSWVLDLS